MKSYKYIEEWEKEWNQIDRELWKEFDKNIENFIEKIKKLNKKPNNNAPKSIKGDYDLSIHGNKIVLVDNVDGTTVEAKCHPDDNFDIGIGIKETFRKLNVKREEYRKQKEEEDKKIKVGDWVEVVNNGHSYSTYPEWLYNRVKFEFVKYYHYGYCPRNGSIGKVVAIGQHENQSDGIIVAIRANDRYVYIVNQKGLKKVVKPNV